MPSRLLLLSLGCQNIPDGCNEPCYPQNIQFPEPNGERTTRPPLQALFTYIYCYPQPLLNSPALLHNPAPSSGTPGKYATLPAHLKNRITDPNHPRLHGRTLFFTFFWVVGKCHYACIKWVRQLPSTDTWEGLLQVVPAGFFQPD